MATMVTAGIFLLLRTSPLIEYSSTVLLLALWIGAITTVFSSLIGLFQQDIKKVIAYSTMSQLARGFKNYIKSRHQTICVEVVNTINSQITKARINYKLLFYNLYISNSFCNSFIIDKEISNNFPLSHWLILFRNLLTAFYLNKAEKWKIIVVCKLVGISEIIRLVLTKGKSLKFSQFFCFFSAYFSPSLPLGKNNWIKKISPVIDFKPTHINKIINKRHASYCLIRKYSTATTNLHLKPCPTEDKDKNFNEWLAGLIDGDGYFNQSKQPGRSVRLKITLEVRDKKALYEIMHKFGGSVKKIAGANAVLYNLSNKKGLVSLINAVNGNIRNSTRMLQMNKLCVKYNIPLIQPKPLTFHNGWLSGFIDSDGSIYYNERAGQATISASQKNNYLLQPLIKLYGGRVDPAGVKTEAFKYVVYRKNELYNLIDNYFSIYPLRTMKQNRVNLIKQFFDVRTYNNRKNREDLSKLQEWRKFEDKWEKYQNGHAPLSPGEEIEKMEEISPEEETEETEETSFEEETEETEETSSGEETEETSPGEETEETEGIEEKEENEGETPA